MGDALAFDYERGATFDPSHGHTARRDADGPYCATCGARPHWPIGQQACTATKGPRRIPKDWKPPRETAGVTNRAAMEEPMGAARTDISEEKKREAVDRFESGAATNASLAREFNVSDTAILTWRKKYGGGAAPRPTRTVPPKGATAATREQDVEKKPQRAQVAAAAKARSAPAPVAAKKATAPKRSSATRDDQDTLDMVESLELGLKRALAVLAIIEAPDGREGIESLEDAAEILAREIQQRRAS